MNKLVQYIQDHWILVPLAIFIATTLAMACRKDRGEIIFKKRKDVLPEEQKVYYLFHALKYSVIMMVIVNVLIKLIRGDYN